ncbi:phage tail protein [Escherichia coli]|uniref:phage tail protein n=1 Tax=Escherichia coli TaxID=562 RepID=UPI0021B47B97|nr:phage tail protein [Escherichia coli]
MNTDFYSVLTDAGLKKLAAAAASGNQMKITHMAVGDGNGKAVTPGRADTRLVREKYRAPLNSLEEDTERPGHVIAEMVIPEKQGGWWIREFGLFDEDGGMIVTGKFPDTWKPAPGQGGARLISVKVVVAVSHTENIVLKVDPSVVMATREWVNTKAEQLKKELRQPDATTKRKGIVQLSSDINSTSETQAATPGAVKAVNDRVDGKQDADPTLTSLSGKNAQQLRQLLGLGTLATLNRGTGSGNVPDMSHFASKKADYGYQCFPGGIMIQWLRIPSDHTERAVSQEARVARSGVRPFSVEGNWNGYNMIKTLANYQWPRVFGAIYATVATRNHGSGWRVYPVSANKDVRVVSIAWVGEGTDDTYVVGVGRV